MRKKSKAKLILIILIILIIFIFKIPGLLKYYPDVSGQIKVHFIDVGQGDSILVQQGKFSMLIDGGNAEDSDLVTKYIENKGITKLDYIIGTHPHEDHIGGLKSVIEKFKIEQIYMPNVKSNSQTFMNLIYSIRGKGLNIKEPISGNSFKLGEANCLILAPNSKEYKDTNNYSIVIKVSFGNNSFLFQGDAEALSEMEIIKKGYDLSADVLKVGHHGSNSSTTSNYLNEVSPKYCVISVGENNTYGHPEEKILNRLKNRNIKVLRTDQYGTIVFTSDGKNIEFASN